jgi:hypothetical protein
MYRERETVPKEQYKPFLYALRFELGKNRVVPSGQFVNTPKPYGICPERQRLMQEYADTVLAHSEIIQTYREAQWKLGFNDVLFKGGLARMATENARMAFEGHITEHGCGSLSE